MGLQDEGSMSTFFAMMMFCMSALMVFLAATIVGGLRDDWYQGGLIFKFTGFGLITICAILAACCLWLGVWMASGGPLTA